MGGRVPEKELFKAGLEVIKSVGASVFEWGGTLIGREKIRSFSISRLVGVEGSFIGESKSPRSMENLLRLNLLLLAPLLKSLGSERGDVRKEVLVRCLAPAGNCDGPGVAGAHDFLQGVSGGAIGFSKPGFLLFRLESRPVLMNAVCNGFTNLKLLGVEYPAGADDVLVILISASKDVLSLNGCLE